MKLESGMRVRCVDDSNMGRKHAKLTNGKEYVVVRDYRSAGSAFVEIVDDTGESGGWLVGRFKPVVRVKAATRREYPDGSVLYWYATFA